MNDQVTKVDPATATASQSLPPSDVKEVEEVDEAALFADLVEDFDERDEPPAKEPEVAKEVPLEEPAPEPVQTQEPAPAPVQEPGKTEQPPQSQQPGEGASQTTTDLNAQYQEFFGKSVEALEKTVYALPPEVVEELDTNPSKVIPKLASTLHMQVLTAAVTQMANMFPAMMELHMDRRNNTKATEDRFFNEYPALKGHEELIQRIAATYRQMHPQATYEQIAPEVAAMAMVQARIPMNPTTPEPPAQKPAIPTGARGGVPAPVSTSDKSTWDELIEGD